MSAGEAVPATTNEATGREMLGGPRLVVLVLVVVAAVVTIVRLWQAALVPTSANPSLRTIALVVGDASLTAEVARSPQELSTGAMFRSRFAPDHGMLLVWPKVDKACLWMRNTSFPVSAAFIDPDGLVVDLVEMRPHTDNLHCPSKPIRYALEAPAGWFSDRGVQINARVKGLESATLPRARKPTAGAHGDS